MNKNEIKIVEAQDGAKIPVINGVYLHSNFSPTKEAAKIIDNYSEQLTDKDTFLVLGLGFGYHIQELQKRIANKNSTIIVIEPNKELVNLYIENIGQPDQVKILNVSNEKILYEIKEFVEFLNTKPCVIKHSVSFQIESDFYKRLLTHKSPNKVSDYKHLIHSDLQDFLFSNDVSVNFEQFCNRLTMKESINSRFGFLSLALNELNKSALN